MKKIFFSIIILLVIVLLSLFAWRSETLKITRQAELNTENKKNKDLKSIPLQNAELIKAKSCPELKSSYADLENTKKNNKLILSFENTHLEVNNQIYRLRHFFKDGDEGLQETFLVYQEDPQEHLTLAEKTIKDPGPIFIKLKKNDAKIIYREVAYTIAGTDLFIHFINEKLIGAQGNTLDCTFH